MNFQEVRNKHPELEVRISRLETQAKIAEIMLDLKDHEGVKMLLEQLEKIVREINTQLLSEARLETEAREVLLADRERCLWFIRQFPMYEQTLKKIEQYIQKL